MSNDPKTSQEIYTIGKEGLVDLMWDAETNDFAYRLKKDA